MPIEVFNRHEQKYLLDSKTFNKVLTVMDEHMQLDKYNVDHRPYTISNIYFDTDDNNLIRTSLSKPKYKEKLRLRSYGVPSADSKVFLEIKKKVGGIVNKRRTVLNLSEAYGFVSSGKPPILKEYMNKQVVSEIEYFLKIYDLKPKVYLAYDRIAYFDRTDPDLRISFDRNIRSRRYNVALEDGDYGESLLPDGTYLMEIKTSKAFPLWLTQMLAEYDIKRRSFSKYGTEFTNQLQMNIVGGIENGQII